MGRVLQKWNAETHEDILLAVVKHHAPKADDWRAIVASLHELGHTFSESALQYVYGRHGVSALRSLHCSKLGRFSPSSLSPIPSLFSPTDHRRQHLRLPASTVLCVCFVFPSFRPENTIYSSHNGHEADRVG
jgi:hypothetical protein